MDLIPIRQLKGRIITFYGYSSLNVSVYLCFCEMSRKCYKIFCTLSNRTTHTIIERKNIDVQRLINKIIDFRKTSRLNSGRQIIYDRRHKKYRLITKRTSPNDYVFYSVLNTAAVMEFDIAACMVGIKGTYYTDDTLLYRSMIRDI